MDRRMLGGLVALAGAVLLVLSALAEPLGLGDGEGFGWKQTGGVVVGIVVLLAGLALLARRGGVVPPRPN